MPELSALKSITRPVSVEFYGETVTIDYRPAAMTVEVEELIFGDPVAGEDAKARILSGFAKVIASWDVTSEGEPVPVTVETLREVPRDLLFGALRKIGEDQSPGKTGAGASSTP